MEWSDQVAEKNNTCSRGIMLTALVHSYTFHRVRNGLYWCVGTNERVHKGAPSMRIWRQRHRIICYGEVILVGLLQKVSFIVQRDKPAMVSFVYFRPKGSICRIQTTCWDWEQVRFSLLLFHSWCGSLWRLGGCIIATFRQSFSLFWPSHIFSEEPSPSFKRIEKQCFQFSLPTHLLWFSSSPSFCFLCTGISRTLAILNQAVVMIN